MGDVEGESVLELCLAGEVAGWCCVGGRWASAGLEDGVGSVFVGWRWWALWRRGRPRFVVFSLTVVGGRLVVSACRRNYVVRVDDPGYNTGVLLDLDDPGFLDVLRLFVGRCLG